LTIINFTDPDLPTSLHHQFKHNGLTALPCIKKWTIDFDDCDRVLRIESPSENTLPLVINEVGALGLLCMDLED
jgi:hypothetical protein